MNPFALSYKQQESRGHLGHLACASPLLCNQGCHLHASRNVRSECESVSHSVQLLSRVSLFVTPWTAARQTSLSITISQGLLKLMSIESVMPPSHLILCRPLLLPPSIFPSISVFSNKVVLCIRCPNCWEFQLQHQSFQ